MKKISQTTIIKILIVVIAILAGLLFYVLEVESTPSPLQGEGRGEVLNEKFKDEALNITAGNTTANLSFSKNQSLYEILKENSGKMAFNGKNYSGLGFFITDIGTLHQGSGKYLIYYINGVEASLGISAYIPKDGDKIEWKLKGSL